MSEKRRDSKGVLLRTGESQRKDQRYQYRYQDAAGVRRTIYADTLKELRDREEEIGQMAEDGLDYAAGNISVNELLQRYVGLKTGVRYNTKVGYKFVLDLIKKEPFGKRKIRDIKVSDAKLWFKKMHKDGRGYSTIMANAGMDIKTLQYVMGHSDVGVTLNVYTHASYDRAAEQMLRFASFQPEKGSKEAV